MGEWLRTLTWLLCTGGLWSPLRKLPENQPFRVVRCGMQLLVEPIPVQHQDPPVKFEPGQRVVVLPHAGFHRGAHGEVSYHAPDAKVWVRRDNSGADAYYLPHELRPELPHERPPAAPLSPFDTLRYMK